MSVNLECLEKANPKDTEIHRKLLKTYEYI